MKIEEVADALFRERLSREGEQSATLAAATPERRAAYMAQARAAIAAMREPTIEMLADGNEAARAVQRSGVSGMTIDAQIRNRAAREAAAWTAMIDAALDEGR